MDTLARALPTLLTAAAFLVLAVLIASVCAAHGRWERRRAARAAERRARPHSVHAATAAQDAAAILHAALTECPGCAAEQRTRDVLQMSVLELYPPDHTCRRPERAPSRSTDRIPLTRSTRKVLTAIAAHDGPVSGYRILVATGLSVATVYPVLDRLMEHGWVTGDEEAHPAPGRPLRRVYQLTDAGRAAVRVNVKEAHRA
ncbi:PadR family transcriptional regulator [Streptomyces wuyuanensis]|uniref:PadR family transcriptional regulator n=1 Tax=Streptomyces wuyuanensis TaxID=1196353 RepID=UPI00379068C6